MLNEALQSDTLEERRDMVIAI